MPLSSEPESKSGSWSVRETTVLIIGARGETGRILSTTLVRRGFKVAEAPDGARGLERLRTETSTRLVVIALPIPETGARALVAALRELDPQVPFLIAGRDHDVSSAEGAIAIGAADYLDDPTIADSHELLSRIGFVVGARRGDRHLQYLHSKDLPPGGWQSIIGESSALQQVVSVLRQVCARAHRGATPTISLGGETGTGKGYIARCVHANGARKNRPFVEVNCAALPGSLIEAELFGHERGSFTDAKTARMGLFETANGGTLFLDEIGAVPLEMQAKLLTAIEEKRIRRLGSRSSTSVDVQIIAATHADLRKMAKEGTFREDLFHRLNVVSVTIPPLRERGGDVLMLGDAFLQMFCREYGMPRRRLGSDARQWMLRYGWPGNVRELKNQIERIVLLGNDEIVTAEQFHAADELTAKVHVQDDRGEVRVSLPPGGVPLEELEREILREALQRCEGNVSRAARFLSISRQTFIYRMKKHRLSDGDR